MESSPQALLCAEASVSTCIEHLELLVPVQACREDGPICGKRRGQRGRRDVALRLGKAAYSGGAAWI